MIEQCAILGFEPPEHQEFIFLESILSEMKDSVYAQGGEPEDLTYKSTENYTVVFFSGFTSFRLKLRGNIHYISLPITFMDLISEGYPTKRMLSDAERKYIRIFINKDHPIESYKDFLVCVAGETVNRYPKEWDCCSRYRECSDKMACVHPNRREAIKCGYRKILHSGRIFYGKNRNID